MLGANHIANHNSRPYATGSDFCRIFQEDMKRLYLLSFLLTADHATAEKCFVLGLEDSKSSNPVFKEWAESWARRSIIANAIRMMHPRPQIEASEAGNSQNSVHPDREMAHLSEASPRNSAAVNHAEAFAEEVTAILALPSFQRFAFVMSVLEGYSNREASLLLDCSVTELVTARTHALQHIGGRPELHRKLAGIDATEASLAQAGAAYTKEVMLHLAAPA
jgi:DNA-directed RNA polymerase specialized sigma24 family protein